jgi:hypothetical protein
MTGNQRQGGECVLSGTIAGFRRRRCRKNPSWGLLNKYLFRTFSERVEHQLKKDQITHQTPGYPRLLKRGNIYTETLFIISKT